MPLSTASETASVGKNGYVPWDLSNTTLEIEQGKNPINQIAVSANMV